MPVAILKLFKSKWDWNHETEPSESLLGRALYLCRGKVLGGSSCTNVMLYTRGAASDYDGWAEACGDASWAADSMLGYFRKAERCTSADVTNRAFHGYDGPHAVSDVPYQNDMSKAFLAAASEHPRGFAANKDFNDWSKPQTGFGRYQVAQDRGVRVTAASAYLGPEVRKRPNLSIVTGAVASAVAFQGNRAVGVDVECGAECGRAECAPTGEVLSCVGAIGSPQLLLLSGVGPRADLDALGIPVVRDLAGVGSGLQDHPAALVSFTGTPAAKGLSHSSRLRFRGTTLTSPAALAQWAVAGTGPLTSPGCDHGGFVRTDGTDGAADVQYRFLATKTITADGMSTIADGYKAVKDHPDGFTIQAIAARPNSRGKVSLNSRDARDKPCISDAFLSDSADVDTLVRALKLGREIAAQPALAPFRGAEEFPGPHVRSDADLADYVRRTAHSANALVGTCKLGRAGDDMAVVDNQLRVFGLEGLRVIDASVMPTLPGGQTCSSTIAIAEKIADDMLVR
ncbi:GMC oxidoreductase-domain-containing protein [Pelagophyceae sp. CCMP2097]|nr:GMC oxidoreductase-domain-containing protein [Pelagophyceae sp. CCMP2097]